MRPDQRPGPAVDTPTQLPSVAADSGVATYLDQVLIRVEEVD